MLHRNEKRKITAAEDAKPVKRVGYVPRDRQESLTDTGLTSAGLLGRSSPPPVVQFYRFACPSELMSLSCNMFINIEHSVDFTFVYDKNLSVYLRRNWTRSRLLAWRAWRAKTLRLTKGLMHWGEALTTYTPSPTP